MCRLATVNQNRTHLVGSVHIRILCYINDQLFRTMSSTTPARRCWYDVCHVPYGKTLDHNRPNGKRELGPARLALQNTIELVCGISPVARADARRRDNPHNETLGCVSIYARRCRVACQCEQSKVPPTVRRTVQD